MSAHALRQTRSRSEESLSEYFQAISRYPVLTREEELALALRAREGDATALDQLVCANLRFVVSVAKTYQHRGVSLPDLINEGNLGLLRAAERFDETKGVKLITYAVWWIRQAMIQAIADQGDTVRIPLGRTGEVRQERRVRSVSIDTPPESGTDINPLELMADETSPAPDAQILESEQVESLAALISTLNPRQATILRSHYGIDGGEPMTLEQIGERLGITRERVRQIESRALFQLRRAAARIRISALRSD